MDSNSLYKQAQTIYPSAISRNYATSSWLTDVAWYLDKLYINLKVPCKIIHYLCGMRWEYRKKNFAFCKPHHYFLLSVVSSCLEPIEKIVEEMLRIIRWVLRRWASTDLTHTQVYENQMWSDRPVAHRRVTHHITLLNCCLLRWTPNIIRMFSKLQAKIYCSTNIALNVNTWGFSAIWECFSVSLTDLYVILF